MAKIGQNRFGRNRSEPFWPKKVLHTPIYRRICPTLVNPSTTYCVPQKACVCSSDGVKCTVVRKARQKHPLAPRRASLFFLRCKYGNGERKGGQLRGLAGKSRVYRYGLLLLRRLLCLRTLPAFLSISAPAESLCGYHLSTINTCAVGIVKTWVTSTMWTLVGVTFLHHPGACIYSYIRDRLRAALPPARGNARHIVEKRACM